MSEQTDAKWWLDVYCGEHDGYHLQRGDDGTSFVIANADDPAVLDALNAIQGEVESLTAERDALHHALAVARLRIPLLALQIGDPHASRILDLGDELAALAQKPRDSSDGDAERSRAP